MRIAIPTHSVVLVVGGKRDPIAEVIDLVPFHPSPWNVMHPDAAIDTLHAALNDHGAARVAMRLAHAKGVRDVIAIARKHGAETIVLRLPHTGDVTDGLGKAHAVYDVAGPDGLVFELVPMPSDLRHVTGPFDAFGDIHGAVDELEELLTKLGHMVDGTPARHADGRIPLFLGDFTDRGPRNVDALNLVRRYTEIGGLAISGNHDAKVRRALRGKQIRVFGNPDLTPEDQRLVDKGKAIRVDAGLAITLAETDRQIEEWRQSTADWLASLQTHLVLDGGSLVAAHAGLDTKYHGRHSAGAEKMALYGRPIKGGTELDEDGYPLAEDWALTYEGAATVVHGHVVYPEPRIVTNANGGKVVAVDLGAVFGGALAAYHHPEETFTMVRSHRTWFSPKGRQVMA